MSTAKEATTMVAWSEMMRNIMVFCRRFNELP